MERGGWGVGGFGAPPLSPHPSFLFPSLPSDNPNSLTLWMEPAGPAVAGGGDWAQEITAVERIRIVKPRRLVAALRRRALSDWTLGWKTETTQAAAPSSRLRPSVHTSSSSVTTAWPQQQLSSSSVKILKKNVLFSFIISFLLYFLLFLLLYQ